MGNAPVIVINDLFMISGISYRQSSINIMSDNLQSLIGVGQVLAESEGHGYCVANQRYSHMFCKFTFQKPSFCTNCTGLVWVMADLQNG